MFMYFYADESCQLRIFDISDAEAARSMMLDARCLMLDVKKISSYLIQLILLILSKIDITIA